jgi:nucleotide-binding universal stress UspA family protein
MVFPPRRILAACDLSPASLEAWERARALAERFGAELEAVHVVEWLTPEGVLVPEMLTAAGRRALVEKLERECPGGSAYHVREGLPVVGILSVARRRRADLLTLSSEGRTGLSRLARGSVAEAVVRESPVPVLTYRGVARAVRSVLAPVNLEEYSIAGFAQAAEAARAWGATITLLHVLPDLSGRAVARFRLEAAVAALPEDLRRAVTPRVELAAGQAVRRIASESSRHDLVALVAHRKGLLRDAVLGTTAEQVLRLSRVPVLTVPAAAPLAAPKAQARRAP